MAAAAAALRGRRFKWALDLGAAPGARPRGAAEGRGPLGFADRQLGEGGVHESDKILMEKRCWDVALAPLKQIPMNLFIMYMAGNTISIFPAMMVCMMGWRPLQALMSLSASECSPRVGTAPRGQPWVSLQSPGCPHSPLNVPQPPRCPSAPWVSHSPQMSHSGPTVPCVSLSPLGVPTVPWVSPQSPGCPHSPLGVPQPPGCPCTALGVPEPPGCPTAPWVPPQPPGCPQMSYSGPTVPWVSLSALGVPTVPWVSPHSPGCPHTPQMSHSPLGAPTAPWVSLSPLGVSTVPWVSPHSPDVPQPPGCPRSPLGVPSAPWTDRQISLTVTPPPFPCAQQSPCDAAHPPAPLASPAAWVSLRGTPIPCVPSPEGPGELQPAGTAGARVPGGQRAGAGTGPLQMPGHGAAAHPPLGLAGLCHPPAANGVHWGGPDLVTPCAHPPIKAVAGW